MLLVWIILQEIDAVMWACNAIFRYYSHVFLLSAAISILLHTSLFLLPFPEKCFSGWEHRIHLDIFSEILQLYKYNVPDLGRCVFIPTLLMIYLWRHTLDTIWHTSLKWLLVNDRRKPYFYDIIYHSTSLLHQLPWGHKESTSTSIKLFSGKAKSISQQLYSMII